jgi:hypothetical protein
MSTSSMVRRDSFDDNILKAHYRGIENDNTSKFKSRPESVMRIFSLIMSGVALFYLVLFTWAGLRKCARIALNAFVLYMVILGCLRSGRLLAAKIVMLFNWYCALLLLQAALGNNSGAVSFVVLMGVLWSSLFEDVHLGNPWLATGVALVNVAFYIVLATLPHIPLLREDLSEETLRDAVAWLNPSFGVTALTMVCITMFHLKKINFEREAQLQQERYVVDKIVSGLLPHQLIERLKVGEEIIADWRPVRRFLGCALFLTFFFPDGLHPVHGHCRFHSDFEQDERPRRRAHAGQGVWRRREMCCKVPARREGQDNRRRVHVQLGSHAKRGADREFDRDGELGARADEEKLRYQVRGRVGPHA